MCELSQNCACDRDTCVQHVHMRFHDDGAMVLQLLSTTSATDSVLTCVRDGSLDWLVVISDAVEAGGCLRERPFFSRGVIGSEQELLLRYLLCLVWLK